LTWLLVGYPLWWVLGLAQVLSLVAAGMLLLELLHRRRVIAPRGFLVWMSFLAWLLVGVLLLQVDAPGTVHGTSNTRYLTFSFRFAWYSAATVLLLYLGNMRKELSVTRITRAFACLFVTVVAGGVLGTVAPHLDFPSAIELLLPRRITSIPFVRDLVHPVVAQLNLVDGVPNPRASAPFAYTNGWALNFAVLLPFFLIACFGPEAGWRRRVGPLVLVVALIPVIVSVNRGLWIALALMALFIAVRATAAGRPRSLAAVLAGVGLVLVLVASTPLGDTVSHRLDNGYSDDGRADLSTTTVQTALDASPIVGFGTTRDVQGSFRSIAGGSTASCPQCAPPALGTQGHLWGLIFATGVGGLVLYLGFYLTFLARGLRLASPYAGAGASVIVAHLATMPFYDIIGVAMFSMAAGVGLIWRAQMEAEEAAAARTGQPRPEDPTLGGYALLVRDNAGLLSCCALIGLTVAGTVQYSRGPTYAGEVGVLISREPAYPGVIRRVTTLDTIAQTVTGPQVQDAVLEQIGRSWVSDPGHVSVGAIPNTRILEITVEDPDAAVAREGAEATARALLGSRGRQLAEQRRATLDELEAQEAGLAQAVSTVDRAVDHATSSEVLRLEQVRTELTGELSQASSTTATVTSGQDDPGTILAPARGWRVTGGWNVALTGGLMLGLACGMLLSLLRHAVGRRSSREGGHTAIGLPVLARLPADHRRDRQLPTALTRAVLQLEPLACLAVGDDPHVRAVARRLDEGTGPSPRRRHPRDVVVVLSEHAAARDIDAFRTWAEQLGLEPSCAVVLEGTTNRRHRAATTDEHRPTTTRGK
jgi:hypothetical protein